MGLERILNRLSKEGREEKETSKLLSFVAHHSPVY